MKALCVKQPWADLIASSKKTIELRTWTTKYRGPLLICASKHDGKSGETVCIVNVDFVGDYVESHATSACTTWEDDDDFYAWHISEATAVNRVPVVGKPGFFDFDIDPQVELEKL